ncbi:hypothetical protein FDA33_10335 [Clostridium botulinum]|uniref:TraG-D_C-like conjugative protein n=1 Tax=Clostridium botulinum TaxID=1491 RepID=A0A126JHK4_CLOBO|nr:type IV secretion system DNA-binding domain-containing protein [Clostridium botulinum]ALT05265.1 TraG-D_C- like conjugative protein [Clostridium botulinum]NFH90588.1 hypothetical protein [Clostridium botulinum]NFI19589.1 hypothetical protein [Clostridium botulinum]NFN53675.1 hypothetical protein [Clostridium botulinum]
MNQLKKKIEYWVDKSNPEVVDKISFVLFGIISIFTFYFFVSTFKVIVAPVIDIHSKIIYTLILIIDVSLFYFTMLGEKTNKPINRPKIFFVISIILALNIYSLLAETFNNTFTTFLNSLVGITEVPNYLLNTNIKIMSIYVPICIVFIIFLESFTIPFKKDSKNELLEYKLDILTKNINEVSNRTVNLKICEDIESGEEIILSEQASRQHTLISGSSGSGKTALALRPQLAQLFYKKGKFREELKELAFKCIEDDICYLKVPLTNKYINQNFSMDYIGINPERKEEFLNIFDDYIIGVRESTRLLYNNFANDNSLKIPLKISNDVIKRDIVISVYINGMILKDYNYVYKNGEIDIDNIKTEQYNISVNIETNNSNEKMEEFLLLDFKTRENTEDNYTFKVNVTEHSEGKIIYRDLGITVVAPDGGLPEDTFKIANENGVKLHKIDPKIEEIEKGNIAKFNPLMVGTPEKAADVISSILVAMEQSKGKDANPYFTNASIRAIRNLVILLRVTYPKLRGKNPTLLDVLDILNNFNSVREYVEELQKDSRLELRWKSVIDYFVSSFYPQPKDEKGNNLYTTNEGVNRKKTAEAISGTINQLDNLLGREELRYILCDAEEGLNLSDVLERGECIAIATRQSELGNILGKAFALMFILSMQNAVLCRYSEDENPEIPHYLVIDELPFYLNDEMKVFFTFSRKYKCSLICVIQNIAQLCEESEVFKQIVFSNTATKLILPGSNIEDKKYYSELLGTEEVFETQTGISQNPIFTENAKYSESTKGTMTEKYRVSTEEISQLKFKRCYYVYTNSKGKKCIGKGYIDFLKLTDNNTIEICTYDFSKYNREKKICDLEEYNELKKLQKNQIDATNKVNEYTKIEEVDIGTLEFEFQEEILDNNCIINDENTSSDKNNNLEVEKIQKLKCIEEISNNEEISKIDNCDDKATTSTNFLENKLLKSKKNIINKDDEKIINNNILSNTDIENTDIENLDLDKLQVEGLSE